MKNSDECDLIITSSIWKCQQCGRWVTLINRCPCGVGIPSMTPNKNPYVDESFAERLCDYCNKPYRGPAVYCSLDCALADA